MIDLFDVFSSFESKAEFDAFMADLMTPKELREVKARWKVAQLLWSTAKERAAGLNQVSVKPRKGPPLSKIGFSQKDIINMTGVAASTVTRVSKCLFENSDNGYRSVLSEKI